MSISRKITGTYHDLINFLNSRVFEIASYWDKECWAAKLSLDIVISEIGNVTIRDNQNDIISENDLAPWKKIFTAHFHRMWRSSLIHQYDYGLSSNISMIMLAHYLAKVFSISHIELLYPALTSYESIITSTNLRCDEMPQTSFVISDDGKTFIEIKECLLTAMEDAKLKHTQILNGSYPLVLSESEAYRVINSSVEARELYEAIQNRYQLLHDGTTVGACLQRLVEGLRGGGAQKSGEEMSAGEMANLAILEFAHIYAALPQIHLEVLKKMPPFLQIWKVLALDQQEKIDNINKVFLEGKISKVEYQNSLGSIHSSTQTCVEINAISLESFIKLNKDQLCAMKINSEITSHLDLKIKDLEENLRNKLHWFNLRLAQEYNFEKSLNFSPLPSFLSILDNYKKDNPQFNFTQREEGHLAKNTHRWVEELSEKVLKSLLRNIVKKWWFEEITKNILPLLNSKYRKYVYEKLIQKIRQYHINQMSCSNNNVFFLVNNGNVLTISNTNNQLYFSHLNDLPMDAEFVQIATSPYHTLFLSNDGKVFGSGISTYLGLSNVDMQVTPTLLIGLNELPPIYKVAASDSYSLFLTRDGKVYGYGGTRFASQNPNNKTIHLSPVLLNDFPEGTEITHIAAGKLISLFLTKQGQVYICAEHTTLQPNLIWKHWKPTLLKGFPEGTEIIDISIGGSHVLFLSAKGEVYGLGSNQCGQLGLGDLENRKNEVVKLIGFPTNTKITKISAGNYHSLFISMEGQVYGCGANSDGQLSYFRGIDFNKITHIKFDEDVKINIISASSTYSLFITCDNEIFHSGYNIFGMKKKKDYNPEILNLCEHNLMWAQIQKKYKRCKLLMHEENSIIGDLSNLTQTCKAWNSIFKPKLFAAILMKHVINADWNKVERLTYKYPTLMFENTYCLDLNGETIWISPIAYALKVHDTNMLSIFERIAVTNNNKNEFLKHVLQQTKAFDLEPLRKVYQMIINETSTSFLNLGCAQRQLMPRHILKHMCAQEDIFSKSVRHGFFSPINKNEGHAPHWSPRSSFRFLDSECQYSMAFNNQGAVRINIISNHSQEGILGVDYALIRGWDNCAIHHAYYQHLHTNINVLQAVSYDLEVINCLMYFRHNQQKQLIEKFQAMMADASRALFKNSTRMF